MQINSMIAEREHNDEGNKKRNHKAGIDARIRGNFSFYF